MTFSKDRRTFDRFQAHFPVRFEDALDSASETVSLRDVSAIGAKLSTSRKIDLKKEVGLCVDLNDGHAPVKLKGRIVWKKSQEEDLYDLGIEFKEINFMKVHRIFEQSRKV